jgi:hypothetical protein
VSTSPSRPRSASVRNKRPSGCKSSAAEKERRDNISSGARSVKSLVAIGEQRLKIAERCYQVAIFSDLTIPDADRKAFYAKRRAQVLAEDAAELIDDPELQLEQNDHSQGANASGAAENHADYFAASEDD